jgi:hypothetical protein
LAKFSSILLYISIYWRIFIDVEHNINPDYLFGLFDTIKASNEESADFEPMEHPYILMGLIISGVKSFDAIASMYYQAHPKEFKRVYERVQNKYYDRLYSFIEILDPSLYYHLYECNNHGLPNVQKTLSRFIREFERSEEYERCARVKKLLDALEAFEK